MLSKIEVWFLGGLKMEIKFQCLYCGAENTTKDIYAEEYYISCEECNGLHDIEVDDNGEVSVVEF